MEIDIGPKVVTFATESLKPTVHHVTTKTFQFPNFDYFITLWKKQRFCKEEFQHEICKSISVLKIIDFVEFVILKIMYNINYILYIRTPVH